MTIKMHAIRVETSVNLCGKRLHITFFGDGYSLRWHAYAINTETYNITQNNLHSALMKDTFEKDIPQTLTFTLNNVADC